MWNHLPLTYTFNSGNWGSSTCVEWIFFTKERLENLTAVLNINLELWCQLRVPTTSPECMWELQIHFLIKVAFWQAHYTNKFIMMYAYIADGVYMFSCSNPLQEPNNGGCFTQCNKMPNCRGFSIVFSTPRTFDILLEPWSFVDRCNL